MRWLCLLGLPLLLGLDCVGEACPVGYTLKDRGCVKNPAAPEPAPAAPAADAATVTADAARRDYNPNEKACQPWAQLGEACACPCTSAGCNAHFTYTDGPCCFCTPDRGVVCRAKVGGACPTSP